MSTAMLKEMEPMSSRIIALLQMVSKQIIGVIQVI